MHSGLELIPRSISDLSRARRAAGLTLEEVALRSRVPEALLRELELGDLRNWPTGLYARTEVVRYARAAGLDERDVLTVVIPLLEQRVGPPDLDATQLFPAEDDSEQAFPAEDQLWSAREPDVRLSDAAVSPAARPSSLIFEPIPATWPIAEPPSRVDDLAARAELRYRPAAMPPPSHEGRYAAGTIAASCIAAALVGVVGWRALTYGANETGTESSGAAAAAVAQPVEADPSLAPEPVSNADVPEPAARLDSSPSTPLIGVEQPLVAEGRTTENVDRAASTSGQVTQPAARDTPSNAASPPPAVHAMETPSPLRGGALEAMALPAVDVTAPPPAAVPTPAPAPAPTASPDPAPRTEDSEGASAPRRVEAAPSVDQRTAVRAALQRYEAAYSDLDAPAARAVWPAVDERALARAFDGLASQRVSLGQCDVVVNGATARATCSGRAAWTPKVGGGERTASRRWAFELRSADGAWQIVRADAQ